MPGEDYSSGQDECALYLTQETDEPPAVTRQAEIPVLSLDATHCQLPIDAKKQRSKPQ